jgi:purine-binding chemotaxis protein CheW
MKIINSNENKQSEQVTFLQFDLGRESYGVKLLSVKEVITVPEVTPLPNGPSSFQGIMNLRGQIISIVDLRKKLGIKSKENIEEEAVVIVDFDGVSIGLIVDSINKVLCFNLTELVEIPEVQSQVNSKFIQGVHRGDDKLTLVLDLAKIFNLEELQQMAQTEQAA